MIPEAILQELLHRLHWEQYEPALAGPVCQGTPLSREQYLTDIACWGYHDARLLPRGPMTAQSIASWTAAIGAPELPAAENDQG